MQELPNNIEAEKAAIGSILIDSDIAPLIFQVLRPDDFYEVKNSVVYKAMLDLEAEAAPVDFITVVNKLKEQGRLETIGGQGYLTELMQSTPSSLHADYYAQAVKDFAKLRNIVTTASKVVGVANGVQSESVKGILDKAANLLYNVLKEEELQGLTTARQLAEDYWDDLSERIKNPIVAKVTTGFPELDIVTGGFVPSDLIIIAGRPSWGKTSLAMTSLTHLARSGVPSVLFPYEMSKLQTTQRFISQMSGVPLLKVKSAVGLTQSELDKITMTVSELSELPLYIDGNAFGDIYYLVSAIRGYVARYGVKVVCIDYLQIIPTLTDDLTNEFGKITRALKTLATALDITIILVSQLNRNLEHRDTKRPRLSDLRQSGRIEEDADIVIFTYRDLDSDVPEMAELIVAKNRNGPAGGAVEALFDPETTLFTGRML
jgi:replicative DNA helicase